MYALINNSVVVKFPYTSNDLKTDNPDTSFPDTLTNDLLNSYGVYAVTKNDPSINEFTHTAEISGCEFINDGWFVAWTIREKTQEELSETFKVIQNSIVMKTQMRLDTFARTRNYDGILSLCTYATSTIPKFQSEGQYGVNARDATWNTLYQILEEVQLGTRVAPTSFEDIEPDLPELVWPTS
jgi:hypothetical protein